MDPDRAIADEVESKALAPTQETAPVDSRSETHRLGDEAREAFLHMMNNWDNIDDDPEKVEFWLENTIREEFRKKYISQWFIDQKRKEFLELKQGRMSVVEYEREFVKLSKYAQECVSTKAIKCKRFEGGLNEDI
ncbi:uncharacterized protein LOC105789550 [Gossypium raimondii]|uniref:uncharacterized protein LOC105789550 n=1 Tax=Gossypium raimondii TaxID=29730 RepID=UPI00063AFAF9|nr:uncharacterized protein LOC105789550 [Gossypium raimondii]